MRMGPVIRSRVPPFGIVTFNEFLHLSVSEPKREFYWLLQTSFELALTMSKLSRYEFLCVGLSSSGHFLTEADFRPCHLRRSSVLVKPSIKCFASKHFLQWSICWTSCGTRFVTCVLSLQRLSDHWTRSTVCTNLPQQVHLSQLSNRQSLSPFWS